MRLICLLVLCFAFACTQAQPYNASHYPKEDFRYPLDLAPSVAGSFGDLRPNHFHSGLDFRTNQREGYPVYAVADGYVARLRVQIGGFGQAIYLNHPNGYTSVYAHLRAYAPSLAQKVKSTQYGLKQFDVDFPLNSEEIPVKKGQLIGWSGNTGSSGGPHLHFEIRDTQTEETINPQLFGLTITDTVNPEVKTLYMYDLNGSAFSEKTNKKAFPITKINGEYRVNSTSPILLSADAGLGIVAFDRTSPQGATHGLYSIELSLDGYIIYNASWERFSFDHTKAINSHLDYYALKLSGISIHKSFVDPGNPIQIYTAGDGHIKLTDNQIHQVRYTISDVAGNSSSLSFDVQRNPIRSIQKSIAKENLFSASQDNSFNTASISLNIPKGTFYNDIAFEYDSTSKIPGTYSAQHRIHKANTPLHQAYSLRIKTDARLPEELINKALIVDTKGIAYESTYQNGWVSAQVKSFGTFYVSVDTIAPSIVPISLNKDKVMTGRTKLIFKIADRLSGIGNFAGTVDGQWILFEYDQKTGTLWHSFDERIAKGSHQLELQVQDKKGNTSTYKTTFIR
ncbi:MAG: M23 family metallopeptidase [Sphingobacteriaceae bacterium]